MKAANKGSLITASTKALRMFLQSAALALGAGLAIAGDVSAGTIIAASIVMSRALAPVEQATAQWPAFQNARRAYGRLKQVLDTAASNAPWPMQLPQPRGVVSVEQLLVTAPNRQDPIVSNITFAINPGDGLGIIGPSGSGKSTLARALVGVWPIAKGAVRIDGATLDQWPPEQLGRAIGYVPQDVELFSGTVRENIARFETDPDPAAVVLAAQRANVHEMILRLPEGYGTELGEGGSRLSAGQKQRLALARALYGNPAHLVLDEPNSNLDTAGEEALAAAISALRQDGVTIIVIAHRKTALTVVDQLLYLHEGRQVAFGPKEEVLRVALQDSGKANPRGANVVAVNGARRSPHTGAASGG
jgi:ATP-binding cassette subfamily C protein